MLNIFSSQNPLGINISDSSIKLAQIGSKGFLRILQKIKLPEGCVINGEIIKEEETVKTLQDLIKEASKIKNISTKEVVCSIPEKVTYLKIINITKTSGNLENQIYDEISNHIPEEIDKLYIDWQIINEYKEELNNHKIEILVGAGRRDIIEKNIRVIEKAGLIPILMEIESLAIARELIEDTNRSMSSKVKIKCVESKKKEPTIGILDIGLKTTSFIIHHNTVRFNANIPFSDEKIIKLISETLQISYHQAKKAKTRCGLDEKKAKGSVKKILSPIVSQVIKNIEKIEDYYINYANGNKFDRILLCGEGANLFFLDKEIEKATKTKTNIGDTTINLKIPLNDIDSLKKETLQYEASIGSALIGYWMSKK